MNFGTKHLKLKIYPGDHPPPHCHLERADETVTRVAIPTMIILSGPQLSRVERNLIMDNIEKLCNYYDEINPDVH